MLFNLPLPPKENSPVGAMVARKTSYIFCVFPMFL